MVRSGSEPIEEPVSTNGAIGQAYRNGFDAIETQSL